jgi:hypothetical protein
MWQQSLSHLAYKGIEQTSFPDSNSERQRLAFLTPFICELLDNRLENLQGMHRQQIAEKGVL